MQAFDRSLARRIELTSLQLFVAVGERGAAGSAAVKLMHGTCASAERAGELVATA